MPIFLNVRRGSSNYLNNVPAAGIVARQVQSENLGRSKYVVPSIGSWRIENNVDNRQTHNDTHYTIWKKMNDTGLEQATKLIHAHHHSHPESL